MFVSTMYPSYFPVENSPFMVFALHICLCLNVDLAHSGSGPYNSPFGKITSQLMVHILVLFYLQESNSCKGQNKYNKPTVLTMPY